MLILYGENDELPYFQTKVNEFFPSRFHHMLQETQWYVGVFSSKLRESRGLQVWTSATTSPAVTADSSAASSCRPCFSEDVPHVVEGEGLEINKMVVECSARTGCLKMELENSVASNLWIFSICSSPAPIDFGPSFKTSKNQLHMGLSENRVYSQ